MDWLNFPPDKAAVVLFLKFRKKLFLNILFKDAYKSLRQPAISAPSGRLLSAVMFLIILARRGERLIFLPPASFSCPPDRKKTKSWHGAISYFWRRNPLIAQRFLVHCIILRSLETSNRWLARSLANQDRGDLSPSR